jgi:hypothetical protein
VEFARHLSEIGRATQSKESAQRDEPGIALPRSRVPGPHRRGDRCDRLRRGPAGVAAAIAAARAGARTRLIEIHGCLGGTWTAGQLAWIWDIDKPGLARELTDELERRDARISADPGHYTYDIEALKLLLEELCLAAGVQVRFFTRVVAAVCDDDRRLRTGGAPGSSQEMNH